MKMKRFLIPLTLLALATGCRTQTPTYVKPIEGSVFFGSYQGEGLYVEPSEIALGTITNAVDFYFNIFNGYPVAVFLNVDPNVMFTWPAARDVTFFDSRGNRIASGSIGRKSYGGSGGHTERYVRIPPGHVRKGTLVRMCTNITSIPYRCDITNYVPDIETGSTVTEDTNQNVSVEVDLSARPIPGEATTVTITVPIRVIYYLEGNVRPRERHITIRATARLKDPVILSK